MRWMTLLIVWLSIATVAPLHLDCSFIAKKEQRLIKLCFYRCENNDIYVEAFTLGTECELNISIKTGPIDQH